MPVTQSSITKDQFRGDILQRDYSARYNPETQTYEFDYVEMKPEIEQALKDVTYYRFESKDIAEVEKAISDYIAKVGPTPPRVPGPKGEITKAAEEQADIYGKSEKILQNIQSKLNSGEELSPEETVADNVAKKEGIKVLHQKKIQSLKERQNAMNSELEEGTIGQVDPSGKHVFTRDEQEEYDNLTEVIEAYETLEKLNTKNVLNAAEQAEKDTAEAFIRNKGMDIEDSNIPKPLSNITTNLQAEQAYKNAKALVTQLKNKKNISSSEKLDLEKAKVNIAAYEATHPEAAEAREEKEALMAQSTRYNQPEQNFANLSRTAAATIRRIEAKPTELTNNEKKQVEEAGKIVNAYNTYTSANTTENEKKKAKSELTLALTPSTKGFFGNINAGLQGGKRKTKKVKKSSKSKTRKQ